MTAIVALIAKTRIQSLIDQVLNTASMHELKAWQDAIGRGARLGDLIEAGAGGVRLSPSDLDHMLNHVYNRNGQGWWGGGVEEIATEGMAQAIQRMLYDKNDRPRAAQKRIDSYWLSPGAVTYYSNLIMESEYQITLLAVTPPKPDHRHLYEAYKQLKGERRFTKDKLVVPANLTKDEDIWVVTSTEDAMVYGVDEENNPVKLAKTVRRISPNQQVTVVRTRCEDFDAVHIQDLPTK